MKKKSWAAVETGDRKKSGVFYFALCVFQNEFQTWELVRMNSGYLVSGQLLPLCKHQYVIFTYRFPLITFGWNENISVLTKKNQL